MYKFASTRLRSYVTREGEHSFAKGQITHCFWLGSLNCFVFTEILSPFHNADC